MAYAYILANVNIINKNAAILHTGDYMKWFKKSPKAVDVLFRMQTSGIDVQHIVEHKPLPRPVSGYITFTNMESQRWHTPPFYINGKTSMPIIIPKAWITGIPTDHEQLKFELVLEY